MCTIVSLLYHRYFRIYIKKSLPASHPFQLVPHFVPYLKHSVVCAGCLHSHTSILSPAPNSSDRGYYNLWLRCNRNLRSMCPVTTQFENLFLVPRVPHLPIVKLLLQELAFLQSIFKHWNSSRAVVNFSILCLGDFIHLTSNTISIVLILTFPG